MTHSNKSRWMGVAALAVLTLASSARAGLVRDVGIGLGLVGFDLQGRRNFLSGGVDVLLSETFQTTPFDFGATDLTLTGPISVQLSTGRGVESLAGLGAGLC